MSREACYLGVDGGGTKTEALIADAGGRILGRGLAGPSNPYFVGRRAALAALRRAVRAAHHAAGHAPLAAAALCVPGLRQYADAAALACALGAPEGALLVEGDDRSTFYGALGGDCGAVVLAGTGSFAMGVNRQGEWASVGGWGPVLGDEGSGYWIGLQALRAVILASEGRGPETMLTALLLGQLGLADVAGLRARIYGERQVQRTISALVPLVAQAAEAGDAPAAAIIAGAGRALAALGIAVVRRLGLDGPDYALVLAGGVSRLGPRLHEPFQAAVRAECPAIALRQPRFSPAVGALLLALRAGGVAWGADVLGNLEATAT